MTTHRIRYSLYGVAFLVGLVVVVALAILQYNRAFDSTATVHLEAPRAGLLLDDGAAVKLRGVTIGRVSGLHATASGAAMDLEIDPDQMHLVPADARAQIVPPTLFGGKYVDLVAPSGAGTGQLAAGATIQASHVTVEINATFQHLMALLKATKPAEVSAALAALANALDGRGEEAGRLLSKIDVYLREINPQLGTLHHDLQLARPVLDTYADLAPSLLDTARNVTTTSDSIEDNRASLDAFLLSLTSVARHTTKFVDRNKHNLTTALDVLQPGERVLAEYAPEFPCFFRGLAKALPLAEAAIGGKNPGLGVLAQFLPPQTPYKYPRDLPKIGADTGPRCYGLPDIPMGKQVPNQTFDVGPNPYDSSSPTPGFTLPSLLELLFGPIEGATG